MAGRKTYRGSTASGGSVILGAPFWEQGKKITGIYMREWKSAVGECYEFLIPPNTTKPTAWVDANGRVVEKGDAGATERPLDKFSMGALTGFVMAIQDLNAALAMDNQPILRFRDELVIQCVGMQKSGKRGYDDMVTFELEITNR